MAAIAPHSRRQQSEAQSLANPFNLSKAVPIVKMQTEIINEHGVITRRDDWDVVVEKWRTLTGHNEPEEWQLSAARNITLGRHAIVLAPTGRGKSTVWLLIILAALYKKQKGFILLIGVTKAMQEDQVNLLFFVFKFLVTN